MQVSYINFESHGLGMPWGRAAGAASAAPAEAGIAAAGAGIAAAGAAAAGAGITGMDNGGGCAQGGCAARVGRARAERRPHRDASAQQDGSLQRPGHGRHFQLSRSRPAAPWRELGRLHVAPGGASDFGPEVGHPFPGVSGPHKATLGPRAPGAGAPLRVRPGQGFPPPCRRGHARFWSLCDAGAVPSTRAAEAFGDCIAAEQILVKC